MSNSTWGRWLATLAISAGVMLEVVDTTVVNVALPQIIGSLGATLSDASWVVSGYILANVIVLPISGWLGDRFGRKRYFLTSMALFTVLSFCAGPPPAWGSWSPCVSCKGWPEEGSCPQARPYSLRLGQRRKWARG